MVRHALWRGAVAACGPQLHGPPLLVELNSVCLLLWVVDAQPHAASCRLCRTNTLSLCSDSKVFCVCPKPFASAPGSILLTRTTALVWVPSMCYILQV